jgi:hypothetical protein
VLRTRPRRTGATQKAEREGKYARLMANIASANTLASPTVETLAGADRPFQPGCAATDDSVDSLDE